MDIIQPLDRAEVFNLIISNHQYFSFIDHVFVIVSKVHNQTQIYIDFSPMYSRSFLVLHFTYVANFLKISLYMIEMPQTGHV